MDDNGDYAPDYRTSASETEPWMYRMPKVPHYYGDAVRQAFVGAAALMLLGAPFYANDLQIELPFEIIGAVVLVAVAALTNPRTRGVILSDTLISGVGFVTFELWALTQYPSSSALQFGLRQALALVFMFAFYFSMKTLRSMAQNQIGEPDAALDFHKDEHSQESDSEHEQEAAAEQRKMWKEQKHHQRWEYDG